MHSGLGKVRVEFVVALCCVCVCEREEGSLLLIPEYTILVPSLLGAKCLHG